jgi:hypothetical protein
MVAGVVADRPVEVRLPNSEELPNCALLVPVPWLH